MDLATARIRNGWMKFQELFGISNIQSSPIGDERSSVCKLCQKQHELCFGRSVKGEKISQYIWLKLAAYIK